MFNKFIKGQKKEDNKKLDEIDKLRIEMQNLYTFSPPSKTKQKAIDAVRSQMDIERAGMERQYAEERETLLMRHMKEEIKILKETIIK